MVALALCGASASSLVGAFAVVGAAALAAPDDRAEEKFLSVASLRAQGFVPIFDGVSLKGWDVKPWHQGHWVARDGIIDYDGKAESMRHKDNTLWTRASYGDFMLYIEWRLPGKPTMKPHPIVLPNGDFLLDEKGKRKTTLRPDAGDSGLYFRGDPRCQANIWSQILGSGEINGYRVDRKLPDAIRKACIPSKRADRPFGEWNWFMVTIKGDRMTVVLNGEEVIHAAELPRLPERGPIALQHHGDPVQFRNLLIKEEGRKTEDKGQRTKVELPIRTAPVSGVAAARVAKRPSGRPVQGARHPG